MMQENESQTFEYNRVDRIAVLSIGVLFLLLGASVLIFAMFTDTNVSRAYFGIATVLLLSAGALAGLVRAFLRTTDIRVTDRGLTRLLFGRDWLHLSWGSVSGVRVSSVPDFANFGAPISHYFIEGTGDLGGAGPRRITVFFSSEIQEFGQMIDMVNRHILGRDIPIVDSRPGRDSAPVQLT